MDLTQLPALLEALAAVLAPMAHPAAVVAASVLAGAALVIRKLGKNKAEILAEVRAVPAAAAAEVHATKPDAITLAEKALKE